MQINIKCKFRGVKISKICHYSKILKGGLLFFKFASYGGVIAVFFPRVYGHFGIKKALLPSARSRVRKMSKRHFLVQNVKN